MSKGVIERPELGAGKRKDHALCCMEEVLGHKIDPVEKERQKAAGKDAEMKSCAELQHDCYLVLQVSAFSWQGMIVIT